MNTITIKNTFFNSKTYDFDLPKLLECALPTEERGLKRDEVKLLISDLSTNNIYHKQFKDIGDFLEEGDVLVVNTSGTTNAALSVVLPDGEKGRVHLSAKLFNDEYLVEFRAIEKGDTKRYNKLKVGDKIPLKEGGVVEILKGYYENESTTSHLQLWIVQFHISIDLEDYLAKYGKHIKYLGVDESSYPSFYYQTSFVTEMGSTEMPSAGRAFTPELISKLVSKGIQFAPILLHTGISSLEANEQPYPEYFRVSESTANLINSAKERRKRVIAIGTTAIRAIESSLGENNEVVAGEGLTNLFITPEKGLKVIDAMLTGFHEPKASHLLMMEALASQEHLELCYRAAIANQYKWHEFGDLHLIISFH